jgi:PadR family transcriptional regulator, regulatory protein PadR
MHKPVEFRQGAIELLILKTLSWGPQHGFSIASWIQQTTDEVLRLEEGSLYPTLHRLEDKGWVTARWGTSANNRRAKFYELTPAGRVQLGADAREWWRYAEAVGKVLTATARPSRA